MKTKNAKCPYFNEYNPDFLFYYYRPTDIN